MEIVFDKSFAEIAGDSRSAVFEVKPSVFSDTRGSFCEVLKQQSEWPKDGMPLWFSDFGWVRQVNRSKSKPGTVRGCHAQRGTFCQGKLVQALTTKIYDVITDARPDSTTFGSTNVYELDPNTQNQLWVPRGFLHAFVVPKNASCDAVFEYFCDNVYNKASETGVTPTSLLPNIAEYLKDLYKNDMKALEKYFDFFETVRSMVLADLSAKDVSAKNYEDFILSVKKEYEDSGKVWYR